MAETDRIYGWISNVINSCEHPSHIEPCGVLITFYEKKGADPYLIKALRESLKIQVLIIQDKHKNKEQASKEDEVWIMFSSGKYNVKQISDALSIKLLKCHEIINNKMRKHN